jgi:hypothetical protein
MLLECSDDQHQTHGVLDAGKGFGGVGLKAVLQEDLQAGDQRTTGDDLFEAPAQGAKSA